MTLTQTPPVAESVEQVDREAAAGVVVPHGRWPGFPSDFLTGRADKNELTQALARHRLAAYEAGRAEGVLAAAEAVRRTSERIGGVEIEAMEGDNLAILLCAHFDDVDGEQDDNGWTEAATTGCEQALKAIAEKYDTAIRALSKEPTK